MMMARSSFVWLLALALSLEGSALAKKPKPAPPAPVPAPAPAPAPEPEPEPVPEPETPPTARPHNADFGTVITWADGSSSKGHVVRVERTEDWYGEQGYTDDPNKLKVTLEGGGTEVEKGWNEIRQVDITYGDKTAVDCSYDSAFTPTMYMCTLRTTTKVKTADGKIWDGVDRHKWMFVLEGGETPSFFLSKLPARRQEEEVPSLGTVTENTALYEALQTELMSLRTGKVPKSITITAP
jgi:hypothetical protein